MQTITIGDETVKQETLVPLDEQDNPVTLYGGTVTIYDDGSADVVSEWGFGIVNASDLISQGSGTRTLRCATTKFNDIIKKPPAAGYTRYVRSNLFYPGSYGNDRAWQISQSAAGGVIFAIDKTKYNDFAGCQEFFENNTVQLTFLLATPITYHFTNLEELKVWLGENNFWCDISDDISVKYWNRGFGN